MSRETEEISSKEQNERMRLWFESITGLKDALLSEHMDAVSKKLPTHPVDTQVLEAGKLFDENADCKSRVMIKQQNGFSGSNTIPAMSREKFIELWQSKQSQSLYENALDISTDQIMKAQQERNEWKEKYEELAKQSMPEPVKPVEDVTITSNQEFFEEYKEMVTRHCIAIADVDIRKDDDTYFFDCNLKECIYIMAGNFSPEQVVEEFENFEFEGIDKEGLWHIEVLLKYHRGDDEEPSWMEILFQEVKFCATFEERDRLEKEVKDFDDTWFNPQPTETVKPVMQSEVKDLKRDFIEDISDRLYSPHYVDSFIKYVNDYTDKIIHAAQQAKQPVMQWVKAIDRLPVVPNPLPPCTDDERGILFINRKHSSAYFWFSSYGDSPTPYTSEDGHWSLDQYEWLEETPQAQSPVIDEGFNDYIKNARITFNAAIANIERSEFLMDAVDRFLLAYDKIVEKLNQSKL